MKNFSQVSAWSSSGVVTCYGHIDTDIALPGAGNADTGKLSCNPIEWEAPLGPEAMFFTLDDGREFEIWAVRCFFLSSNLIF